MAYRGKRVSRLLVRRMTRFLMGVFPSGRQYIVVKRQAERYNDLGERVQEFVAIYKGPALGRSTGGTSETYGLGTVENIKLEFVIDGVHDIRQSDIVTINDGREYEVAYPPTHLGAVTQLQLATRSQITQET